MYKRKLPVGLSSHSQNHPLSAVPFARLTLFACMVSLAACGGSGGSGDSDVDGDAELQSLNAEGPVANSDGQSVDAPANIANSDSANTSQEEAVVTTTETQTEPVQFDFFGKQLEIDTEQAIAGGPPTKPKNLHVNLLGNDWVELDWAPSNDDGRVVSYRVYRNDGVSYTVASPEVDESVLNSRTLKNYWETTTFIDCNFTHVRSCDIAGRVPAVGSQHSYQVSAVDELGNESEWSDPLAVTLHAEQGGVIEKFSDPYLDGNDDFQFVTDLSDTTNFMDQFEMVWSDEFTNTELDGSKWSTSLTWRQEDQNIINGEMQYFVDIQSQPDFGYNPFILNGETLAISAIRTPPLLQEKALGQPFLSGALSTHELRSGQLGEDGQLIQDKFAITYGYVEGRIRVGQERGMLTSFYLFRRWEAEHSPEIDIIEYLGENPFGDEKAFQTYHYRDVNRGNTMSTPTMQYPRAPGTLADQIDLDGFHTYSVLWEPNLVIWYINGKEVQRLTGPQVSRQSMNVILYLVTGSGWAPTPDESAQFPFEIEIDYIRAYKRKPWNG